MNLTHKQVNHSKGFISPDGTHTNTIEGFGAHLRDYWRERHGVSRERLEHFLAEFKYLKQNVNRSDRDSVKKAFIQLLTHIFGVLRE